MSDSSRDAAFEPVVVAFLCHHCAYAGADAAGAAQRAVPASLRTIRLPCLGRMDAQHVLKAFAEGADAVLLLGCHPGDCHYEEQNLRAAQRHRLMTQWLAEAGIAPQRCRLEFVAATEGEKFARVAAEMVEEARRLGPLPRG